MNSAYIGKLIEISADNPNVLHLLADSGTGFDELFRRYFPDRIYNFGIGEENMIGAAAGMATAGKIPFVYTSGAFLAYRSLEFIRDDICFQNLNVKIVGMGSGISWSSLGPTHHTTEDIAILRSIPNLMILSPATPIQATCCVQKAYEHDGPVYIRLGMNHEKEFYESNYELSSLRNDVVIDGEDIAVFTTGSILEVTYDVCKKLNDEGFSTKLINVVSLKPFIDKELLELASSIKHVFIVEEHNIHGGLAGIISELNTYNGLGLKIIPIGLNDCFAKGYGSIQIIRKRNGLDADSIYEKIKRCLLI